MLDPSISERVIDLAVNIQQIPSKTFEESQRAAFIREHFLKLGAQDVSIDEIGNVYACIRGRGDKKPLIISAHLDTVFPSGTDLTVSRTEERISGPGIGDNSLGLAGLSGVYYALCEADGSLRAGKELPGDIWLVANVAEEGLGNLTGIKAVVNRFGGNALAYIVLEGMSLGQIYHRGLGVRRYRISVRTKGGHSWVDFGNPSAIHELAEIAVKLKHVALPVEPRTSLNIGIISGGTSINTIASEASMELDLRSVNPYVLTHVAEQVEEITAIANQKGGDEFQVTAVVIGHRPAGEIPANHPLVQLALDCYAYNGVKPKLNIGSTDTNEPLSRGYPSICLGLTTGGGAHTLDEYINTRPIAQGLKILTEIVWSIFEK